MCEKETLAVEVTWKRNQKITDQRVVATARNPKETGEKKARWVSIWAQMRGPQRSVDPWCSGSQRGFATHLSVSEIAGASLHCHLRAGPWLSGLSRQKHKFCMIGKMMVNWPTSWELMAALCLPLEKKAPRPAVLNPLVATQRGRILDILYI